MPDTIVVGVDGSEGSALALRWALKEAQVRGGSVKAVTTWEWHAFDEHLMDASGPDVARQFALGSMNEALEAALGELPGAAPPVEREAYEDKPAKALVQASEGADLLVIGSHGHSRLRHMTMGSVSEQCLMHATCPVVVIPLPHDRRREHKEKEKAAR